uniref:Long-chain-fatty-acid--CoA ligase n=1 Tax=Ciona savignyi TaxID=51511 RepID=H2ZCR8_CIOSA
VNTLHDTFLHGLKLSEGGPCLGWRPGPDQPYKWLTYQEVLTRSQHFGSGLLHEGAVANPDQFIGIFSQNRVEWKITEQACNSFSMVVVPLYDTLGPQSIKHIMTQCNLRIVVVDNNAKAKCLLGGVKDGQYTIETLIIMAQPNEETNALLKDTNVKLLTFTQLFCAGTVYGWIYKLPPPKPSDLHTICYTSGTTGLPKGVMLTHGNLVANRAGVLVILFIFQVNYMDNNDVHISYLPLAHVFERIVCVQVFTAGASVGFFQGDVKLLMGDVAALRPTIFPMVPRLINRMYDKVANQSFFKKFLLERAVKSKMELLKRGIITKDTIWDKLVFRRVQNMMGGRGRIFITGAAPVSLEVLNFMRVALGVTFTEGYGQTEATAAISVTIPGDYNSGSVGTPAVSNVVKLVDVPEKNYYAKDGKGEVCVKGTNVFVGYYKDEEKTKETLDEDGWLHTGDVGMWLPNGSLKIIDRKKNIFKLAQGEYIAPEKIESIFTQSPAVAQVFLHGESLKASLVAVVIPDAEALSTWCSGKGQNGTYQELCANENVKKLILEDLLAVGRKRGLKTFELPKKIHLSTELFSVENDLLTPTFKSRRPQLYQRYKTEIEEMYQGL